MPDDAVFLWSGGKDSALALYRLQQQGDTRITTLLTTVTGEYGRISMHGVRVPLLKQQAASIGLSLEQVLISPGCTNEEYQGKMLAALGRHRAAGVEAVAIGDIFLEDVRQYREDYLLLPAGMKGIYPLWNHDTGEIARAFIPLGFLAVVCVVDSQSLDHSFAGRLYDESFLADLPPGVDPCGENGEFHTFVYSGPIFREPVAWKRGEVVLRDGRFWFYDLLAD